MLVEVGMPGMCQGSSREKRTLIASAITPDFFFNRSTAWLLFGTVALAWQWVLGTEPHRGQFYLWALICTLGSLTEFLASWSALLRRLSDGLRVSLRAASNFAVYLGAVLLIAISSASVQLLAVAWLVYVVGTSSSTQSRRETPRWIDLATLWWALGIGYALAVHHSVTYVLPWLGLVCTAALLRFDSAHKQARVSAPSLENPLVDSVPSEDETYPSWVQHESTLHDLSNAMTASLFMVRDLTRALEKGSEPNLRRALRLSQELAGELSQMSDHINTSRQSARWQQIAGSPISLLDPVRCSVAHVSLLYPDVTCRVQCDLSEEQARISVVGGVSTLKRIVENLVINACQALSTSRDKQVHCSIELEGNTVVLTVCDNGPGFPRMILDLHPSPLLSTKAGGSGIGLYSCHQLVKRDGGKLNISNRESGGALVTAAWPQAGTNAGIVQNTSESKIKTSGTRSRPGDETLEAHTAEKR
jgi:two-component system, NtrC family, C4-dicarboxylate transport sensor histidine kinase DctB